MYNAPQVGRSFFFTMIITIITIAKSNGQFVHLDISRLKNKKGEGKHWFPVEGTKGVRWMPRM